MRFARILQDLREDRDISRKDLAMVLNISVSTLGMYEQGRREPNIDMLINNLLSAMIDNHIYYGNELGFEKVTWKRCVDLNDRQLRVVNTGLSEEKNVVPRIDGFNITVASEIMAIFCLSKDIEDLERRLGNIIVGYNNDDKPIFAKDLKAEGALTVLLKDAIKNVVDNQSQT